MSGDSVEKRAGSAQVGIQEVEIQCDALSTSPFGLAWEVDIGMYNPHVPRERIVPRKRLLLRAQMAADLLLAIVMDRILVPSEVV